MHQPLSATASKSIARDLATAMGRMDDELTLSYANSFVGSKLRGKGIESTPETVKAVITSGERRGWFRVHKARVVPALVVAPKVEEKVVVCEPVKLRAILQMYWDDATLNERCKLSAGSRPTLDTAINRVNLYAGEYVVTSTKSRKEVRRDIENLLEKYLPTHERATTSNYSGQVLHHLLGLAEEDGLIRFTA